MEQVDKLHKEVGKCYSYYADYLGKKLIEGFRLDLFLNGSRNNRKHFLLRKMLCWHLYTRLNHDCFLLSKALGRPKAVIWNMIKVFDDQVYHKDRMTMQFLAALDEFILSESKEVQPKKDKPAEPTNAPEADILVMDVYLIVTNGKTVSDARFYMNNKIDKFEQLKADIDNRVNDLVLEFCASCFCNLSDINTILMTNEYQIKDSDLVRWQYSYVRQSLTKLTHGNQS